MVRCAIIGSQARGMPLAAMAALSRVCYLPRHGGGVPPLARPGRSAQQGGPAIPEGERHHWKYDASRVASRAEITGYYRGVGQVNNHAVAKEIDKLGWVYIQDKKILMARSYHKATYYIPGGKREAGESDQAALIREIKEELSVDLLADSIVSLGEFRGQADGKPAGVRVKIHCFRGEFSGELAANAEIEHIAWLTYADRARCSLVSAKILAALNAQGLID
ncbi:NUDIX hydrolase [Edwardsiella tarda]|uniref:NUDIX domain-containing protein n=2 Tax=Edwardsiella tarda TaxID=636 RepID=A0AC61TE35_EDWTA|nr:NUDIX domain-containing protein [Edwardsiella tarda]UCP98969.1 NUDIX domain-containing protein [Edwardsiella tarda ATCC 15947 = NBRC 105688]STD29723.1 pyrimidine (deoxy)nucleoside triphosphate pyrophosphohydrolase [Edwardsiella tarda]